jgi:hypothetical protein
MTAKSSSASGRGSVRGSGIVARAFLARIRAGCRSREHTACQSSRPIPWRGKADIRRDVSVSQSAIRRIRGASPIAAMPVSPWYKGRVACSSGYSPSVSSRTRHVVASTRIWLRTDGCRTRVAATNKGDNVALSPCNGDSPQPEAATPPALPRSRCLAVADA